MQGEFGVIQLINMKKFIPLGFLFNLILVVIAFNFWGLVMVMAVAIGIYKLITAKFAGKSELAEKLMFGSAFLLGIFAIHNIFGDIGVTLIAALIETIFFFIFSSFKT